MCFGMVDRLCVCLSHIVSHKVQRIHLLFVLFKINNNGLTSYNSGSENLPLCDLAAKGLKSHGHCQKLTNTFVKQSRKVSLFDVIGWLFTLNGQRQ